MEVETIKSNVGMSWEIVELKDIAAKTKYPIGDGDHGAIKPSEYLDTGVPYIRVADMNWSGEISEEKMVYISEEVNNLNPKSHLFPGDIIISKTGATIGKVAIIPKKFKISNTTASIGKISINRELANERFVFWAMKAPDFQKEMWKVSHKSAQPGFNVDDLKRFKIPLPPLATQKRIAEILDAADALRRKDQELLKKYDELAQAIFIDMFGNPVKNEKGWNEDLIKNIASKEKHSIKAGPFGSSLKKEFYKKSGYKIYGQEQVIADDFSIGEYYIDEDKFQQLKSCAIKEDDILISLVGTYGKISVVPKNIEMGIINPRLMKISLNRTLFNPQFFKYLLQTKQMYDRISTYSRGGTMDIVNVGIISDVLVIIPPLKRQDTFVSALDLVKEQKNNIEGFNVSDNLFNSLIQKAFKGELE
jgi:type I restriction enzyme S subunit